MTIDRGQAVNLATNVLANDGNVTSKGVRNLALAVLAMDKALAQPHGAESIPDAYLVNYHEDTKGGSRKNVTALSFEPETPVIMLDWDKDVASRTLIKVTPLYSTEPAAQAELAELRGGMEKAGKGLPAERAYNNVVRFSPEQQLLIAEIGEYSDNLRNIATTLLAAKDTEIATLRADAERMDYLERELELEDAERANFGHIKQISVFRCNMPITRRSIDAARAEVKP